MLEGVVKNGSGRELKEIKYANSWKNRVRQMTTKILGLLP